MNGAVEAGPLTKYFNGLDVEVYVTGDVVVAVGPDGRRTVDPEPTCEPESTAIVTGLLAEAGTILDADHPVAVQRVWKHRVRGTVSIPVSERLECAFRIDPIEDATSTDVVELDTSAGPLPKAERQDSSRMVVAGAPALGSSTYTTAAIAAPSPTKVRIVEVERSGI